MVVLLLSLGADPSLHDGEGKCVRQRGGMIGNKRGGGIILKTVCIVTIRAVSGSEHNHIFLVVV